MKTTHLLIVTVTLTLLFTTRDARATCGNNLTCTLEVLQPDCNKAPGKWPAGEPLVVGARCSDYCSYPSYSPRDPIDAWEVAGMIGVKLGETWLDHDFTAVEQATCGELQLFELDGTLQPSKTYTVVAGQMGVSESVTVTTGDDAEETFGGCSMGGGGGSPLAVLALVLLPLFRRRRG